ncbi:RibD family protein [Methylobacterium sp. ID0610]|uniref:RibD family protein n=1 Tax=Methylobacterium carpenticola TaxID=3344827 RepID=UPI0036AAA94A
MSATLFAPLAEGSRDQPFVIAQLGQSLDGRIATLSGDSKYINRAAALDHLHRLRAHVDAIVVGIGTVLADDPLLTVRRVAGRSPARIVIDPAGRIPAGAQCLRDADGVRRIVVCRPESRVPAGAEALRIDAPGPFSPPALVAALGRLGFARILIEGGAHTISRFIDAGAIDRLHVMVAPLLLGSGRPGLDLRPIAALREAMRPVTRCYPLCDGDVLFDCDLRRCAPP